LRDAFGDVEENDVPEFLQADEVGQRAANLSRADKRDLSFEPCEYPSNREGLTLPVPASL
jgi:hypothetical protein